MERRVDHKTDNLNTYLTSISGSLEEKTQIVPFIETVRRNGARFLEIGSGGDPVAAMIRKLPNEGNAITIDVIDADPNVLKGLIERHPRLLDDAAAKSVDIVMTPMDATNMHAFDDNTFDGINASSLVHEIFSYADGFKGVAKFVTEVNRVLVPDGIMFYRDPELSDSLVYTETTLRDPNLRALGFFYLANALSIKTNPDMPTRSSTSGLSELYNTEAIHLSYYKKSSNDLIITSARDLSSVMMHEVDFTRDVTLYSEHGVAKELMRHFLTFHQSSPYGTVHFTPRDDGGAKVHYASSNTSDRWNRFIEHKGIEMSEDKILTPENYERSQRAMREEYDFMQGDVVLMLTQKQVLALGEHLMVTVLPGSGREGDDFNVYTVDSLQLSLYYETVLRENAIDASSFVNPTAFHFFQYLKQEVHETYFYFTPDELIAFVADVSAHSGSGYMLVPGIEETANRTTHRPKYDKFLQQSLAIRSIDGSVSEPDLTPLEKKRLIQFTKKPHDEALLMLNEIVTKDEDMYRMTRRIYETLLGENLIQ